MFVVAVPFAFSSFGSLVMNENHPSTAPATSSAVSKPTDTVCRSDCLMLFTARNAFQIDRLTSCTPIFLPFIEAGVGNEFDASDMMQNGLFWYCAPNTMSLAP